MPRSFSRRRGPHGAAVVAVAAALSIGADSALGQSGLWMAMQPGRVERVECVAREMTLPLDVLRPARAVMFRVGEAAGRDRVCAVRTDGDAGDVLAVDRPGIVLAGETVGYAWVRPVGAGSTLLRVGDDSVLIHVVAGDDAVAVRTLTPRVLSPSAGAAVWGTVHVSALMWREPGATSAGALALIVPDGLGGERHIKPVWSSSPEAGPTALASFAVDFDAVPPGDCRMVAVRRLEDGTELRSTPAVVRVVRSEDRDLISGECEDDYGLMGQRQMGPPTAPRSERDATASGGRYFGNAGADPRFRFPVNVPSERGAGWYQVVVTAAGNAAAGAFPAIGLRIDEAERLTGAGQIAQPTWHRAAIGTPIRLEPGLRVLRCDFANDFQTRGVDRNLRMDRIEVLRIADVDVRQGGGDSSAMMTAGAGDGDAMKPAIEDGGAMMAGGAGSEGERDAWPALANAAVRPPVRIAFERPLDGLWLQGESEVRGVVWFEGQGARTVRTPPRVELVINGLVIDAQRTDAPRFTVPPEAWHTGPNSVRLRAVGAGGWTTETTEQVVWRDTTNVDTHARASTRLTIHEPGWYGLKRGQWKDNQGGEGRWSAPLASSSQVLVELPEHLSGEFDLLVECRAAASGQRMAFSVIEGALESAGMPPTPVEVVRHDVPTWFGTHRATDRAKRGVLLGEGKKSLVIAVPPRTGRWESGKGDRNAVWIQAVRLVERPASRDVSGPTATVLYPPAGTEMHDADALVVRAADGSEALRSAELILDGVPTGIVLDVAKFNGFGDIVLPVLLRGVPAGEHSLAARISDDAGNVTITQPRRVRVLDTAPEGGTAYRRAVAALDRFAFGPDQRELAAVLAMGERGYLEDRLGLAPTARDDAAADPALALGEARFPNDRSVSDVTRRALQQAIASGDPVRARFTLWAENHFSTWIRKDEPYRKADEHERFSTLGIARFHDLLRASATSPAMLRYLDQERSFAGRLNENYAREILELHTLGVRGGYTQQDVTNLAHVLTGWTTARQALGAAPAGSPDEDALIDEFSYEPEAAATLREPRTVLGWRFGAQPSEQRHERVLTALEVLDAHPSTARFVCEKLVGHYVGLPADDAMVEDLASVFTRTGGDLRRVLLALAEHPAFAAASVERSRLAHPLDYGVRLCRVARWNAPWDVGDALAASGHGLFDRPTPDGYPEADAEAMDSNALLQRWRLAARADSAIADLVPNAMRWTDRPIDDAEAQRIIDIIAVRLTGHTLGAASNAAALEMLAATAPELPARPEELARDGRIRTVGAFVAQLPEAGVR